MFRYKVVISWILHQNQRIESTYVKTLYENRNDTYDTLSIFPRFSRSASLSKSASTRAGNTHETRLRSFRIQGQTHMICVTFPAHAAHPRPPPHFGTTQRSYYVLAEYSWPAIDLGAGGRKIVGKPSENRRKTHTSRRGAGARRPHKQSRQFVRVFICPRRNYGRFIVFGNGPDSGRFSGGWESQGL